MRFRKGHVSISEERDVPVLLHTRNARAISQEQLWQLLSLENSEDSRRSAQWRITRLEKAELIERIDAGRFFRQPVYSITKMGMSLLEYRGHGLISISSETDRVLHSSQIFHALELVDVHVALAKKGLLRSWKSEAEVVSRNLVYATGVTKDFDAIVEIESNSELRTIGVEYERTVKAAARYTEIRDRLNQDKSVDAVLYLASSYDVLHVLALELRGTLKRIGFALSDDFRQNVLDANTLLNTGSRTLVRFEDFLSIDCRPIGISTTRAAASY